MMVCPQEKFIVTCDRDEKVRVTNYPSAYNIQAYLLGHREFVSCCTFIDNHHVLTGSGDSKIKLWNIMDGRELASVDLAVCLADRRSNKSKEVADAASDSNKTVDRNEQQQSESNRPAGSEPTNEAAKTDDRLAIKKVFCISSLVVVAFFNLPNLVTFAIEADRTRLLLNEIVELPSNLLDAIEHADRLYLLTAADGLISYAADGKQLTAVHGSRVLASINANQELFKFNEKELTNFRLLYKFPNGSGDAEPSNDEHKVARKRKKTN